MFGFTLNKLMIYGGILAIIVGIIGFQQFRIYRFENLYENQKVENMVLKMNFDVIKSALDIQNKNIADASEKSRKLDNQMSELQKTIGKQESVNKKKIEKLLAEKVPQNCEESLLFLNSIGAQIKWQK